MDNARGLLCLFNFWSWLLDNATEYADVLRL